VNPLAVVQLPPRPLLAFAAAVAAVNLFGCRGTGTTQQAPAALAMHAKVEVPALGAPKSVDLPGLHNVVTYTDDVIGGSQPEGKEGLATLAAMGIKTIITVDGSKPDVEGAAALGMRYVHLPISYDTVTPQRQRELAQALSNLEGPIYTHCHHGKHRSAAALGTALVRCGKLTPAGAAERMRVSGTAKDYTGLWQAVAAATPMAASELRADPASFPSVAVVTGMVATMAGIDAVWDLVKQSEAAGWQAPSDHPDLVATKETKRLGDLFAQLPNDPESRALPADYQTKLQKAIGEAAKLDAAVQNGDTKSAAELTKAIGKSCKECHVTYRDK
jgi:protein tyrosine phosphatase (PTP) superfamily phosphohydrolase (DUF442 family)